jgi:hypothetical protein
VEENRTDNNPLVHDAYFLAWRAKDIECKLNETFCRGPWDEHMPIDMEHPPIELTYSGDVLSGHT